MKMILAEKIALLRKKSGWSQEDLAEQLDISRQSVSKWESGTSIPDLDKIIKMSGLFGVSTDYLIKDELEEVTGSESKDTCEEDGRSVSVEEANAFMDLTRELSGRMAGATSLCVLATIPIILLGGLSEYGFVGISEDMAGGIGAAILLILIAIGAAILILGSMKLEKYEYMEKETLHLQYGVQGIVEKKKEEYEDTYRKRMVIGTILCIIGAVPLLVSAGFDASDMVYVCCTALLLLLVAVAVYLFTGASYIHGSFVKLLQQGDYTPEKKAANKRASFLPGVYWCTVTAIFLAMLFYQGTWKNAWIIWPVAGVLYAALVQIVKAIMSPKEKN